MAASSRHCELKGRSSEKSGTFLAPPLRGEWPFIPRLIILLFSSTLLRALSSVQFKVFSQLELFNPGSRCVTQVMVGIRPGAGATEPQHKGS